MNAAAAERLQQILAGRAALRVKTVRIDEDTFTAGLIRQRFAAAQAVEVNEYGIGAQREDGSWLWLEATPQPGTKA